MQVAEDEVFDKEDILIERFCERYVVDRQIWNEGEVSQDRLSKIVDDSKLREYKLKNQSIHNKARHTANTAPNSGSWVSTMPKSPRLRLSPQEYRTACHIRYGWCIFDDNFENICIDCGEIVDKYGVHCLHCGHYGGWSWRHNAIRDCLFRWAQKAQIGVIKEKDGLCKNSGSRPGDIFVGAYMDGIDYAFDVTVTSPYKLDIIKDSAVSVLSSAHKAA